MGSPYEHWEKVSLQPILTACNWLSPGPDGEIFHGVTKVGTEGTTMVGVCLRRQSGVRFPWSITLIKTMNVN